MAAGAAEMILPKTGEAQHAPFTHKGFEFSPQQLAVFGLNEKHIRSLRDPLSVENVHALLAVFESEEFKKVPELAKTFNSLTASVKFTPDRISKGEFMVTDADAARWITQQTERALSQMAQNVTALLRLNGQIAPEKRELNKPFFTIYDSTNFKPFRDLYYGRFAPLRDTVCKLPDSPTMKNFEKAQDAFQCDTYSTGG